MSRDTYDNEPDDEASDGSPDEFPNESDTDDADEPEFVECPFCRKSISEDADRCHHCGNFIVPDDPGPRRIKAWIMVGIVLAIVAVLMWVL